MVDYLQHRIHPYLRHRVKPISWVDQEWNYAEIKEDGRRVSIINDGDKIQALGRKDYLDLWPSLTVKNNALADIRIPDKTMVEVEYVRDHVKTPYFRAFALPYYKGVPPWSLSYDDARKVMEDMGLKLVEQVKLPKSSTREELENYITSRKVEGLVLKLRTLAGWYKLKPVLTADCVVTDYFYGEGKYQGMMGALDASVYVDGKLLSIAHVGGGWKDVDRELKHDDVMGRVMEVKYDCIQKGRLRFPRFYRWRDDKPASECLYPEKGR